MYIFKHVYKGIINEEMKLVDDEKERTSILKLVFAVVFS